LIGCVLVLVISAVLQATVFRGPAAAAGGGMTTKRGGGDD
jgi:hypothetical protein